MISSLPSASLFQPSRPRIAQPRTAIATNTRIASATNCVAVSVSSCAPANSDRDAASCRHSQPTRFNPRDVRTFRVGKLMGQFQSAQSWPAIATTRSVADRVVIAVSALATASSDRGDQRAFFATFAAFQLSRPFPAIKPSDTFPAIATRRRSSRLLTLDGVSTSHDRYPRSELR